MKERAAATKLQRCPQCQADIGVTSYGVAFRAEPVKARRGMTAGIGQNVLLGAGLATLVFTLAALGVWMRTSETVVQALPRDPAMFAGMAIERHPAVITGELPAELRGIPEVALADFPQGRMPDQAKSDIKRMIARIREENAVKPDSFLLAHAQQRRELHGLPYIMGDACKLDAARGTALQQSVQAVRAAIDANRSRPFAADIQSDAGIAALTQILGPETADVRTSFTQQLATSRNAAASRELAKAAIFDSVGDVRFAALKALQGRPATEYNDILLHGMRYPIPAVARRTAQAIITLNRTDLLPHLADMLGEPAPADPVPAIVDDVAVHVVREVVRINHHRNCLLCHAPVSTGEAFEVPALVPTPGLPFPSLSREYYGANLVLSEPAVRADTTYLRQDFSMMLPVANAAPWPEKQRFDFLVRTRVVTGNDLANLQADVAARPANYLSENQKAVLATLRELTGQDAAANPAAWRRVLGQNQ
jgi:hypothetical protein